MSNLTNVSGLQEVDKALAARRPRTIFSGVEGLSGIAAVLIFIRYATGAIELVFAVDLLLATTGFLLTWIMLRGIDEPFSALNKVYESRLKRIYPGLLLLVITTTFAVRVFGSEYLYKDTLLTGASSLLGLANIVGYSVNDLPHGGPEETNALHQLWAVSLMMQFIAVYPLIIAFLARITKSRLWIILAATVLMTAVVAVQMPLTWNGQNTTYMLYSFRTRSLPLLTGSLVAVIRYMYETRLLNAYLSQGTPDQNRRRRDLHRQDSRAIRSDVLRARAADSSPWLYAIWTLTGVAAIVMLVFMFAQFDSFYDAWMYTGGYVLVNVAVGLLLWSLASRRNLLVPIFGFSLFRGLGRISFPLFLLIFPVLWFTRLILPLPPTSLTVALVAGFATVAAASLIYVFLLVPGREAAWKLSVVIPVFAATVAYLTWMAAPFVGPLFK